MVLFAYMFVHLSVTKCLFYFSCNPVSVECDQVTSPSNGSVTMTTNGSSSGATYSCEAGFSLDSVENSVVTCLSSGSWSGPPPACGEMA